MKDLSNIDFSAACVPPPKQRPVSREGYEQVTLNKGTDSEMKVWMPTQERAEHLRAMFRLVAPKGNWKNCINKHMWLTDKEAEDIGDAIAFVAGSPAEIYAVADTVKDGKKRYHIMASGYYACVGA